ncbi:MAG: prolipoprotein diacylglyceryl transferase [Chloroflexi bacterium]|nr:prolipoprotein diacylglyceryl transferase [bacterium]MBU2461734.1 prolipoprotein diacylglyceryl transferase [bacterium]MBU2609313.1 prolipoprotein diacylglyceryl transferase [Chloroflexota bacterium]
MHPILFKIGSISIYSRETILLSAFLIGILLAVRRASALKIQARLVVLLGIYIFISSFVGAKLFYLFFNLDWYLAHPIKYFFSRSGFTFYGGLFLSILVSLLWLYRRNISFLLMGDIFAPSLSLGEAMGRIGCILSGCCYGKPTTLPWGVHFPPLSLPYQHFRSSLLHPVQVYFSLSYFLLFLILQRIKPTTQGKTFFLYLILHSVFRFIIEFGRADSPYLLFNLTTSQVIAIFIGMCGVILFSRRTEE